MGPQRTGVHPRAASICNRNVRYLDCALGGHADGWFPRRMETLDSLFPSAARNIVHFCCAAHDWLLDAELRLQTCARIFRALADFRISWSTLPSAATTPVEAQRRRRLAGNYFGERTGCAGSGVQNRGAPRNALQSCRYAVSESRG